MKLNRFLSLFLVLLVITGSGGDANDNLLQVSDPGAAQLVENAGLGLHEFRETIKIGVRSTPGPRVNHDGCPFSQCVGCQTTLAQNRSFLQRRSEKTSLRLFIDFGKLLI